MLFIVGVVAVDECFSWCKAPELFCLNRIFSHNDAGRGRNGLNACIGSQVRSRKKSEPACEVFPVQRESASGKQHQRVENGAPLRACPVGEIEERARSEKVFCEHELLRCGIPNGQSPIADEFWKAREAPA